MARKFQSLPWRIALARLSGGQHVEDEAAIHRHRVIRQRRSGRFHRNHPAWLDEQIYGFHCESLLSG
jgi:hypothetical protein